MNFVALFLTVAIARPLMGDFIGLNVHTVQFKTDLYKPVTSRLRNYHPIQWDIETNPSFATQFPFARNRVNWQELYGSWKAAGYDTHITVMFDDLPEKNWTDIEQDAYAYGFSLARFFGPSGEHKQISSLEIGNEPGLYSDAIYSRIYENMAQGIRRADPKLRIATCAATPGPSTRYSKSLETVKGMPQLVDLITMHTYAQLEDYPTWKRSYPEDPRLRYLKDVEDVVSWRDKNMPGKPVWITEFGYDSTTQPNNKEGDFKDWIGVTDAEQARYIVRSFLLFSAMSVERAYLYWFNDEDKPTLHASSGVTRNYNPKPSFYAMAHLRAKLADYRFTRAVVKEQGKAYMWEYTRSSDPVDVVWVAWSPTGNARSASYPLPPMTGKVTKAERMPMTSAPPPPVQMGKEIPLTEDPLFIFWRRSA